MKMKIKLKKTGNGFCFYVPTAFVNAEVLSENREYELDIREIPIETTAKKLVESGFLKMRTPEVC